MRISVIIPAFNSSKCIGRALTSVKAQGIDNLEVIIADDGSTDGTGAKAIEIMPEATVVRLAENTGAAAARNLALRRSTGEMIALLDSDDEWVPGKLQRQVRFLQDHPDFGLCGSGHVLVCKDGSLVEFEGRNPKDWRKELHFAQSFHGASTPLMRREVLERVGLLDERLRVLEDWDWMLRISRDFKVSILPEALTLIHENNPSDPDYTVQSTAHFINKHRDEFSRYGSVHSRNVVSQHYENAARNLFRHRRPGEGCSMLWDSFHTAPLRNPPLLAAFPIAAIDALAGTHFLADILTRRNRIPLQPDRHRRSA